MRSASCSCGQLKISCEGEPIRVSICHCLSCKRRSGSAFAITARWPADRVTTEGRAQEYVRIGEAEGNTTTFRFCPTCATTVYYNDTRMPGMIAVPVGVFADPTFPPPQVSVFGERRHPWAIMPNLAVEEL